MKNTSVMLEAIQIVFAAVKKKHLDDFRTFEKRKSEPPIEVYNGQARGELGVGSPPSSTSRI